MITSMYVHVIIYKVILLLYKYLTHKLNDLMSWILGSNPTRVTTMIPHMTHVLVAWFHEAELISCENLFRAK